MDEYFLFVVDPSFGKVYVMKELNHLNICKPDTPQSDLYTLTLKFIRDQLPVEEYQSVLEEERGEENLKMDDNFS